MKNSPFSNERHFEIWFPKKKIITFFLSKLSKLHKTDPILHVTTTFSLTQWETRTSHGPMPLPLMLIGNQCYLIWWTLIEISKLSLKGSQLDAFSPWTTDSPGPSPYFITLFLWPLPHIHPYSDFAHVNLYYMILNTAFFNQYISHHCNIS